MSELAKYNGSDDPVLRGWKDTYYISGTLIALSLIGIWQCIEVDIPEASVLFVTVILLSAHLFFESRSKLKSYGYFVKGLQ